MPNDGFTTYSMLLHPFANVWRSSPLHPEGSVTALQHVGQLISQNRFHPSTCQAKIAILSVITGLPLEVMLQQHISKQREVILDLPFKPPVDSLYSATIASSFLFDRRS